MKMSKRNLVAKSNELVTKSNDLIEARYGLPVNEQRLIILLVSIIQPDDEDFYDYELRATDFAEMFDIKLDKGIYARVEEAASNLVGKKLDLGSGDKRNHVAWLSNAQYTYGKGVVVIRFDKSLKPYLLDLKNRFTQYNIKFVVKFKKSSTIRFYELFKSYEYLGNGGRFYREFSIDELKSFLGIGVDDYKLFGHFKERIIDPSIKEINLYSDIFVSSVEYKKKGRAVDRVKFNIEPKSKVLLENPSTSKNITPPDGIMALLEFDIAGQTAHKWLKDYGNESVMKACRFVRAKQAEGVVKDAPAYLAKALKEGYYVAWIEAEVKKESKRAIAIAKKAEKEEIERQAHEATRRRIDAALEAFHARPEFEQIGLRAVFGNTANPITAKSWKKFMATDPQPENSARFRFEFADFLQKFESASG